MQFLLREIASCPQFHQAFHLNWVICLLISAEQTSSGVCAGLSNPFSQPQFQSGQEILTFVSASLLGLSLMVASQNGQKLMRALPSLPHTAGRQPVCQQSHYAQKAPKKSTCQLGTHGSCARWAAGTPVLGLYVCPHVPHSCGTVRGADFCNDGGSGLAV